MNIQNIRSKRGISEVVTSIIIILLVLVGGVVVLYMTMRAPTKDAALAQTETAESAGLYREVVETLDRIDAIQEIDGKVNLNSALFQDTQFRVLRDGSVKIDPPSNVGRANPFLPFGF